MAELLVKGILIEHEGDEYLLTSDQRYPDLRVRAEDGSWGSIKHKGPGGRAGKTAQAILEGAGVPSTDHAQTALRKLAVHSMKKLLGDLFEGAWGG